MGLSPIRLATSLFRFYLQSTLHIKGDGKCQRAPTHNDAPRILEYVIDFLTDVWYHNVGEVNDNCNNIF